MEYVDFDDNTVNGSADKSKVDLKEVQNAIQRILLAIGEDPERDGLKRTPERIARMYSELLSGYQMDPLKVVNEALFDVKYDEMVIVRDIEFYSLCEHHMLPFGRSWAFPRFPGLWIYMLGVSRSRSA
jgi:GTP cyclohydrolase I